MWKQGRQQATKQLSKLLLAQGSNWDCYLIRMCKDSNIDWHLDAVENKQHHRINITLWGLWRFWRKNDAGNEHYLWQFPFHWTKFRPDIELHKAETFKNTLILSIGWV